MNYWPATNSKSWCAIMRSEKTHTLACNECFGMQWITDAAARSDAMNTPATNSSACNELRMRQRDRVQWMTAADTPSCGQKRHTRWPATNSSACNESRMRQCDRVQWITAADTPSCGQKRHTRWPATNSKCWMAIVRSEKTHTLTCNEFRLVMWFKRWHATNSGWCCALVPSETCQRMLGFKEFRVKQN